jgi:hypothetical protein
MKILITTGIIFITSICEDITTIKEQEHTVIAIEEQSTLPEQDTYILVELNSTIPIVEHRTLHSRVSNGDGVIMYDEPCLVIHVDWHYVYV